MKEKNMIKKILLMIVVFLLIAWMFAWPHPVSGDCMEPAVKDGSYVFVNRIAPYLREYKIGDIVTFNYEEKLWIARIVALENDIIQVTESTIKINGEVL